MEDKGNGLMREDEENSFSVLEGGPSNMEVDVGDGSGDNYEALADSQRDGSDKRGMYDAINIFNSTSGKKEFLELTCSGRRKSRKNKKGGRQRGSKKEVSPEIRKRLWEAIILHADNKDSEALPIVLDVIKEAPTFSQAYYCLYLVSGQLEALRFAATIQGPKSPYWKLLYESYKEQGDLLLARNYASKAVQADPEDIPLKYQYANAGKYKDAAETHEQIFRRDPQSRMSTLLLLSTMSLSKSE